MTTNKLKYIASYNKSNYKLYQFRIRKDDTELINYLDGIKNRNFYINNLIKKDIHKDIYTIKEIKDIIKPILDKYNISEVYLFGSYSRGEATVNSDIDLIIERGDLKGLDHVGIIYELEDALKKKVDVITIGSTMNSWFKKSIMEDMIQLWPKKKNTFC